MVHPLIGLHAGLGELGAIAFIWIFVEMFNLDKKSLKRVKIAAVLGMVLILLSWLSGGYYYVQYYGSDVKPIIKEGPQDWGHKIVTETKEHVFLFIPILAILTMFTIMKKDRMLLKEKKNVKSLQLLSLAIFILAMLMAFMGYLISMSARTALEALV
jgi:ABC-type Na+ efflux pump permease subunit